MRKNTLFPAGTILLTSVAAGTVSTSGICCSDNPGSRNPVDIQFPEPGTQGNIRLEELSGSAAR